MKTNINVESDIDEAINDLINNISDKYKNKPIAAELFLCFIAVIAELAVASDTKKTDFVMSCIFAFEAAQTVNNERMN